MAADRPLRVNHNSNPIFNNGLIYLNKFSEYLIVYAELIGVSGNEKLQVPVSHSFSEA